MPAVTEAASNAAMSPKENKNSLKVLDELMAKLNISKAQEDINAAAHNLAIFINGPIEESDAPTKYVFKKSHSLKAIRCRGASLLHFAVVAIRGDPSVAKSHP